MTCNVMVQEVEGREEKLSRSGQALVLNGQKETRVCFLEASEESIDRRECPVSESL